tara:strand:+ start:55 stop:558 length:504 start_codon:yes stop_codon:yes gene_type:complete
MITLKARVLVFSSIVLLYGCSSATPIQEVQNSVSAFDGAFFDGEITEVSKNTTSLTEYRVYQHGSDGFEGGSPVRYKAESRANIFCKQRNMASRTIREQAAVPPYILGNFPKIELTFVCEPSTLGIMVETSGGAKWQQLEALANLLERGVLTEQEFKAEKEKIMAAD